MKQDLIKDIRKHSVCLYSEKFGDLKPYGSGLLVKYHEGYYLITAYHVMDREEEQLNVEDNPEEYDIPQDDFDSYYIRINDEYILINDLATGIVFTGRYDEETNQPVIDEDTEFCICPLYMSIVQLLLNSGYRFYPIRTPFFPGTSSDDKVVLSGFPKYTQKENKEEFRTYESTLENNDTLNDELFKVKFDNNKAYNFEYRREIQLSSEGIEGMSGGGMWYELENNLIPIGIIIRQDIGYVTGYRLDRILEFIKNNCDKNTIM